MKMELYDKPNNYVDSGKMRNIINTLDCVKDELNCKTAKSIGLKKFSRIFSQYNPEQLIVKDSKSVMYLRIHHNNPLELTITDSQMKFLRVNDRLYYMM